jgi:hypothetical protein
MMINKIKSNNCHTYAEKKKKKKGTIVQIIVTCLLFFREKAGRRLALESWRLPKSKSIKHTNNINPAIQHEWGDGKLSRIPG